MSKCSDEDKPHYLEYQADYHERDRNGVDYEIWSCTQCKWVYKVPLQIVRDFDNAEEYEPSAWFEDYDASR